MEPADSATVEPVIPLFSLGPWQPTVEVKAPASVDTTTLALARIDQDLFLFGKSKGDGKIYWSRSIGRSFPSLQQLTFSGGDQGPRAGGPVAAATSGSTLTFAWPSAPTPPNIWWNQFDGATGSWSKAIEDQYVLADGTGPALATLNNMQYLLWGFGTGQPEEKRGYYCASAGNSGPTAVRLAGTEKQTTFFTPRLVAYSIGVRKRLLALWAASAGSSLNYGTIDQSAEGAAVGLISAPTSGTPVYAVASVPYLLGDLVVLLWTTGQYKVYTGRWSEVRAASGGLKLPADIQGFCACCVGTDLYVAWAGKDEKLTLQKAPVTWNTISS
jgi:hypothetical protein